ncbi:LOW QUALITY PROTEIN: natural cytotoxicity triggering receptor 2 [Eubalaena glacialis]|uniref:LOW QUALITY PROTEIN: natural cytotoxicity triggering receptor 2 n=1 Tax=Eubalaena glacialis TaxID=27606 RepID=UPI002A59840B|nr:LOW QUALITY PROTEIN: natural cytotoxicity triggering receptor 2 [Eubalaena glacialis]
MVPSPWAGLCRVEYGVMLPRCPSTSRGKIEKGKALTEPICGQVLESTGCEGDSWAQHLQKVAGQTLSVRCQYPPKARTYEQKGWCKEVSALKCTRLIASFGPRVLAQASRFSIWDNPGSGFFTVTMTGLREEDSGHYWCRIYHASSRSVSRFMRFYLLVSPAEPLSWGPLGEPQWKILMELRSLDANKTTCHFQQQVIDLLWTCFLTRREMHITSTLL